jgi:hypothetical protein
LLSPEEKNGIGSKIPNSNVGIVPHSFAIFGVVEVL